MPLIIWGRPNSHNVKKVAWLAEEAGMLYERRDIGGKFGFTDAYLAMNPNALIPTIDDDGFILWESNAILRYLGPKYAPMLWPIDPEVRASADRWMDWQISFAGAMNKAFINLVRIAPEARDHAAIAASAEQTGAMTAILDNALAKQPWLSGSSFGIADMPMGCYINTWYNIDIERPDRPHVAAWYERLKQRPAYASQVMIPLT